MQPLCQAKIQCPLICADVASTLRSPIYILAGYANSHETIEPTTDVQTTSDMPFAN